MSTKFSTTKRGLYPPPICKKVPPPPDIPKHPNGPIYLVLAGNFTDGDGNPYQLATSLVLYQQTAQIWNNDNFSEAPFPISANLVCSPSMTTWILGVDIIDTGGTYIFSGSESGNMPNSGPFHAGPLTLINQVGEGELTAEMQEG